MQNVFAELLDSLILDVASEAHRAARLGFDYRLRNEEEDEARTCASARATLGDVDSAAAENSGKYTVDVFEQTHPSIAQEMFDCMNCGRPIVAGRFAPHLEKCMGKVSISCVFSFFHRILSLDRSKEKVSYQLRYLFMHSGCTYSMCIHMVCVLIIDIILGILVPGS